MQTLWHTRSAHATVQRHVATMCRAAPPVLLRYHTSKTCMQLAPICVCSIDHRFTPLLPFRVVVLNICFLLPFSWHWTHRTIVLHFAYIQAPFSSAAMGSYTTCAADGSSCATYPWPQVRALVLHSFCFHITKFGVHLDTVSRCIRIVCQGVDVKKMKC